MTHRLSAPIRSTISSIDMIMSLVTSERCMITFDARDTIALTPTLHIQSIELMSVKLAQSKAPWRNRNFR